MLVVKFKDNVHLHPEVMQRVQEMLVEQAKTGVVILPLFCELLNEVPEDTEIKVIQEATAELYWKPVGRNKWTLTCSACDKPGTSETAKFCHECGARFTRYNPGLPEEG